mmetsp:Transcript_34965/g.88067  ORF Transcript_34965/g.88067 Transcript_34965/m.88067 type:complete len:232 (+) Transcript_34965:901-1596(+)
MVVFAVVPGNFQPPMLQICSWLPASHSTATTLDPDVVGSGAWRHVPSGVWICPVAAWKLQGEASPWPHGCMDTTCSDETCKQSSLRITPASTTYTHCWAELAALQSTILTEPSFLAPCGASKHLPKKLLIDMSARVVVVGGAIVVGGTVVVGDVVVADSAAVVDARSARALSLRDASSIAAGKLGNHPDPILHTWPFKPNLQSAISTVPVLDASKHVSLPLRLWICPVALL